MKPRIVVGHPCIARGGSEATCMWLIQALKEEYDVTLVTTSPIDLAELNAFYGTSIRSSEIMLKLALTPRFMQNTSQFAALRGALYSRFIRNMGREYDLCISAYNLADWGAPGVHFIADFTWDLEMRDRLSPRENTATRLIHRKNAARSAYLAVCRAASGKSRPPESYFNGTDTIIANSKWTAERIEEKYAVKCDDVIWPPVASSFESVSWENRLPAFVSVGRIAPEKRLEQQIDILEAVRSRGHDIAFQVIGAVPDNSYGRMIRAKCLKRPWVSLMGQRSGSDKESILSRCRYAISACAIEAFGITIAEMVKAGCLPFVPRNGGQTEIVPFPELQFGSIEDAVGKIDRTLRDSAGRQRILKQLKSHSELYGSKEFCRQALGVVENELSVRNAVSRK